MEVLDKKFDSKISHVHDKIIKLIASNKELIKITLPRLIDDANRFDKVSLDKKLEEEKVG